MSHGWISSPREAIFCPARQPDGDSGFVVTSPLSASGQDDYFIVNHFQRTVLPFIELWSVKVKWNIRFRCMCRDSGHTVEFERISKIEWRRRNWWKMQRSPRLHCFILYDQENLSLHCFIWPENFMFTLRGNYFLQIHCAHICIV